MRHSSIYHSRSLLFALLLVLTVMAGAGQAQGRSGCQASQRPSVGVAYGRSSPYLELAQGVVETAMGGSVLVYGGSQFTARGDLSIAGPWRLRVEGSTARWDVVRITYDPNAGYQEIARTSVGHIAARQIVAAVGLRGGRAPACGHVLVGGGLYSLDYRGAAIRRPGFSITAGIEVPTGTRGAVQVDMQLHLITTRNGYPISGSAVLATGLSAGWAYRFK